jgi:hypothetical protein
MGVKIKEKTEREVKKEIAALKGLFDNPKFRRYSGFGDDHFRSIRVQIAVLESDWDEQDIGERYSDPDQNSLAYETLQWKLGHEVDESPMGGWLNLIRP